MRQTIGVFVLGTFLLLGCGDKGTQTDALISKTYQYAAYVGNNRTPAVLGSFTLNVIESNTVTGEWSFSKNGSFENIGPQVGTGKLSGIIDKGMLSINLNPNYADNNVILMATLEDENSGIFGTWNWVTFVGQTSEGHFEAIPVN